MGVFDLVLAGGQVVDGTGQPRFRGDIAVKDGRIAVVGEVGRESGRRGIDISEMVVAPGFVDIHSHSDWTLGANPFGDSKVRQGVTTEVVGNCGLTAAPVVARNFDALMDFLANTVALTAEQKSAWKWKSVAEYITHVTRRSTSVNIAFLSGQGTIRVGVMGFREGAPSREELAMMQEMVRVEMEAGAFGISSALQYPPNSFSDVAEIAALCSVVREYPGAYYAVHMRDEGAGLLSSIEEVLEVGRRARVPVQISHLKAAGRPNWGKAGEALAMVEAARRSGIDVLCDQYPYVAFGSGLIDLIPPWAVNMGATRLAAALGDRALRERLQREMVDGVPGWRNPLHELGWQEIMVASLKFERNKTVVGKTIAQIAAERKVDPHTVVFDLLQQEEGTVKMIGFAMNEEEVQEIMVHPLVMIASDGRAVTPRGEFARTHPHPRYYGTFPRVLGRYSRDKGLPCLEEAVRKMTGMPAGRLGLTDRGVIREGNAADLVVFDPDTVADQATFETPHRFPVGIKLVVVNGVVVVEEGEHLGVRPGKVLRRSGSA